MSRAGGFMVEVFLFFFLFVWLAIGWAAGSAHDVTPACPPEAKLCEFYFRVAHNITMTLWPSPELLFPVVVDEDGQYWARLKDCSRRKITTEERERLVTGDGTHIRALLVNGQLPGPPIVVYEGQQVVVRVRNDLENEVTTVHWHGIHQRNTPWMDGAGTVSQCPIQPGETFTYRFLATPVGSHWYHSHYGTQRSMGFHGPLVVLPRNHGDRNKHRADDPLPQFERDFFMVVHDWMNRSSYDIYHTVKHELLTQPDFGQSPGCYHPTRQVDGVEIGITPFFSALINGKGHHFDSLDGTLTDTVLEVFRVRRGEKVHFRLISAAMLFPFRISVDRHDIRVVASDASDVITTSVESVIVQSGERYDFWLEARDPTMDGNYWIRVQTIETFNETRPMSAGEVRAILRYEGAPEVYPSSDRRRCTHTHPCTVLNCPYKYFPTGTHTYCLSLADLRHPAMRPVSQPKPERPRLSEYFLDFYFGGKGALGAFHPTINGVIHAPPSQPPQRYPTKEARVCSACPAHESVCTCNHQLDLPLGHVIQMVFYIRLPPLDPFGMTGTSHPIHVHGHSFEVVKIGWPTYNRTSGLFVENTPDIECPLEGPCNRPRWRNTSWSGGNLPDLVTQGAPRKDTINVPAGGYVVIRFVADNPGFWFLHCHMEFHNEMGMALVLKEGDVTDMAAPPQGMPGCGDMDWSYEEFREKLQFPQGDGSFIGEPTDEDLEQQRRHGLVVVTASLGCATGVLALVAASIYIWYRPRPQPADTFMEGYTSLTSSARGSFRDRSSPGSRSRSTLSLSNSIAT